MTDEVKKRMRFYRDLHREKCGYDPSPQQYQGDLKGHFKRRIPQSEIRLLMREICEEPGYVSNVVRIRGPKRD